MTTVTAEDAPELRVARLESHAAYLLSKAGDLQLDIREMRSDICHLREQMREELANLRAEIKLLRETALV